MRPPRMSANKPGPKSILYRRIAGDCCAAAYGKLHRTIAEDCMPLHALTTAIRSLLGAYIAANPGISD